MENCNSLYLCSVLMPRNISTGKEEACAWKLTLEVTKVKEKNPHPRHTGSQRQPVKNHKRIKRKKRQTNEKQCNLRKLCTTIGVVNKTLICVFVSKRPWNNLFWSSFVQRIQYYNTDSSCSAFSSPMRGKVDRGSLGIIYSPLEWSHPPSAPQIRVRCPRVLTVPLFTKDAHSLLVKKRQQVPTHVFQTIHED